MYRDYIQKKKREPKHNTRGGYLLMRAQNMTKGKNDPQNNPKTINKVAMRTFIPIITLNVNGLNTLTKRQRAAEWIQK